ncbi:MAG: chemotaxis protein CheY [Cyanobacteria bacterium RYN_339]|nr:chemotaxis protein CheY [Cyanobacteria bacterium RYN_339]
MTSRKVLLLVEDNEDNRRLIRGIAEEVDATVIEADNGADGVRMARSASPDLILMDLSLPVMDGWEATARLKRDPLTQGIPVIAITAHAMDGDREKALAAGCDEFVTKPIQVGAFVQLLERFLEV